MGFKIPCPNCGPRNVYEFTFGNEFKEQPLPGAGIKEWRQYLYFNENACGVHEEWWYHSAGCGAWFKINRNTLTNEIQKEQSLVESAAE